MPRRGGAFSRGFGRLYLRLTGWTVEGDWPNEAKLVVAVAPHTSNYDFVLTVAVNLALNLRSSFLAKRSLFVFPFGAALRAFGGISVDRRSAQGLVPDLVDEFAVRDQLVLGIAPEGTRGHVRQWKSGFAQVAQGARVPILPVTLNYDTRVVRFEEPIHEVDSVESVMQRVQSLSFAAWPRRALMAAPADQPPPEREPPAR